MLRIWMDSVPEHLPEGGDAWTLCEGCYDRIRQSDLYLWSLQPQSAASRPVREAIQGLVRVHLAE